MADYISKYAGQEIDNKLDRVLISAQVATLPTATAELLGKYYQVVNGESPNNSLVYHCELKAGIYSWEKLGSGVELQWGNITGTLSDQTDLNNALSGKQNTISSDNKLGADLVDDSSATNKFVTASEKTQITTNQTNIETHTADKTNPHETKVSNLDDVEISSIQDNQILQYDNATSKWKNETFTGAEIIYGDLPQTAENGKYYATPNDSKSIFQMIFDIEHPINSFYQQLSANDNPNTMFNVAGAVSSTWEDVSATYNNKAIWISSSNNAGTSLSGSLPKIEGTLNLGNRSFFHQSTSANGAFSIPSSYSSGYVGTLGESSYSNLYFNASSSNSIYNASAGANIVRPTSITCKLWKRIG